MSKKLGMIISVLVVMSLAVGIIGMIKTNPNIKRAEAYPSQTNLSQPSETGASDSNIDEKNMGPSVENSQPSSGEHDEADPTKQEPAVSDKNIEEAPAEQEPSASGGNSQVETARQDPADSHENSGAEPTEQDPVIPGEDNQEVPPAADNAYKKMLIMGDSILLDIAPNLNKMYDNITIDGKVSRQLKDAINLAPKYAEFNVSDDAVIFELGTNGYFTDKQIDELLDSFSKAHVFLVNTRVPRTWESRVNQTLKKKADERENVILIDWHSLASKHPEYFGRDGVHLTKSGSEAMANLIGESLQE